MPFYLQLYATKRSNCVPNSIGYERRKILLMVQLPPLLIVHIEGIMSLPIFEGTINNNFAHRMNFKKEKSIDSPTKAICSVTFSLRSEWWPGVLRVETWRTNPAEFWPVSQHTQCPRGIFFFFSFGMFRELFFCESPMFFGEFLFSCEYILFFISCSLLCCVKSRRAIFFLRWVRRSSEEESTALWRRYFLAGGKRG